MRIQHYHEFDKGPKQVLHTMAFYTMALMMLSVNQTVFSKVVLSHFFPGVARQEKSTQSHHGRRPLCWTHRYGPWSCGCFSPPGIIPSRWSSRVFLGSSNGPIWETPMACHGMSWHLFAQASPSGGCAWAEPLRLAAWAKGDPTSAARLSASSRRVYRDGHKPLGKHLGTSRMGFCLHILHVSLQKHFKTNITLIFNKLFNDILISSWICRQQLQKEKTAEACGLKAKLSPLATCVFETRRIEL